MSLNRATHAHDQAANTVLSESAQQYATYSEPSSSTRSISGSFSTMSPTSSDLPFSSRIRIHSLSIPKAWTSPICGAGAGFASGIVTCPLDVIKTKLQAQGGFAARKKAGSLTSPILYKGMFGTARTIWREEGLRGLYRGLGPMLMGYLPTWAVYLSVYEKCREPYYDWCGSWWLARCYSSLTAGACSTVLTNPIWVIKTRLMTQSATAASDGMRAPFHYNSAIDAAKKMYRAEGVRSFYSGLTPALLGLTHVAVQFPLYEWFKMKFTGYGLGEHPPEEASHNWLGISAATFLSKVCASTATYPHEVLRTRLQTQQRRHTHMATTDGAVVKKAYRGMIITGKVMLQEEGWRAFYAGIGVNLIRAVPAAMTTMLTYEFLQRKITSAQADGERLLRERNSLI